MDDINVLTVYHQSQYKWYIKREIKISIIFTLHNHITLECEILSKTCKQQATQLLNHDFYTTDQF